MQVLCWDLFSVQAVEAVAMGTKQEHKECHSWEVWKIGFLQQNLSDKVNRDGVQGGLRVYRMIQDAYKATKPWHKRQREIHRPGVNISAGK